MTPGFSLLIDITLGFVRFAFAAIATWMIQNGILTEGQRSQFYAGIAFAIVTLVWTAYSKVRGRVALATALAHPPNLTLNDLKAAMDLGATVPATIPNDATPKAFLTPATPAKPTPPSA